MLGDIIGSYNFARVMYNIGKSYPDLSNSTFEIAYNVYHTFSEVDPGFAYNKALLTYYGQGTKEDKQQAMTDLDHIFEKFESYDGQWKLYLPVYTTRWYFKLLENTELLFGLLSQLKLSFSRLSFF